MPVITLSRQFGAGGAAIGRELAERLGAEYLDREVVALVASRAGIPESEAEGYDERLPTLWQRIAGALAASGPDPALPPLPSMTLPTQPIGERLAALTRAVVEEAAERGNAVIIGRGGAFIVGPRPDALHVFLHASVEARVRYLLSRVEEIPAETRPDEASLRALCRSVDAARAGYLRRHFGVDWNDARNYHLSLDTGAFGIGASVELVEAAARRGAAGAASQPDEPTA